MKKYLWYVLGAVIVVGLALLLWPYSTRFVERETYPFSLAAGDSIVSWSFQGAYTDKPELVKKAGDEIARIKGLFGTKGASDYELYVSIANQYGLMGDGANEWLYLRKALAVDSVNTGLAWYNAGVLMDRLGAYNTARYSYQKAAEVQAIGQYINAAQEYAKLHPAP